MKKNKAYLIILVFLIIGCVSFNNSVEENSTPTSSLSIPSLTFSPTETINTSPTIQIQSTPTIYLSPLPILSFEQEEIIFYRFYNFIDQCRLPCLWGITPGITTWTEMKQFINQFSSHNIIEQAHWSITKATNFDTYIWYVKNPDLGSDDTSAIVLEVQSNIVTAVLVENQLSTILFPIHRLLDEYGEPNKIYINTQMSESEKPVYFVEAYILWEKEHIFSGFRFYEDASINPESRRVCLHEYAAEPLTVWSSGNELNRDFSKSKLLSAVSEENEKKFYERFRYKGNKCFEVSKDA